MNEEKLKLMSITNDKDKYYIFKNSLGEDVKLKVYGDKPFLKDLVVGVVGMCKYNSIWLNKFALDTNVKPSSEVKVKEKVQSMVKSTPFDIKTESILTQVILKEAINLVGMDIETSPLSPNKRLDLTKHYFRELYHFMVNEEYKDLDKTFVNGDEVNK